MRAESTQTGSRRSSLLVPAITSLIVIGVLLSLGFWQLQRKGEKRVLIAALNERLAAPPVALPPAAQWNDLTPGRDEFRRVRFRAALDTGRQAQVYGAGSALRKDIARTGVWIFAPAELDDGSALVVNRGFVGEGERQPPSTAARPPAETLTGYIRFPEQAGWLTPPADLAGRLWFLRDHKGMAEALDWPNAARDAPFYIDLEGPVPPGGVPKPGPLTVNLKDDHLQYAITWFLLALAVAVAFLVWLRGQKRAAAG